MTNMTGREMSHSPVKVPMRLWEGPPLRAFLLFYCEHFVTATRFRATLPCRNAGTGRAGRRISLAG